MAATRLTTEQRFWAKVDKNGPEARPGLGPCWLWTGCITKTAGYGLLCGPPGTKPKLLSAHRLSFQMSVGQIPPGMQVCHRCRIDRGEQRHNARFTPEVIRAIRADYACGMTQVAIGKKYLVKQGHVSDIVLRKSWKHVS